MQKKTLTIILLALLLDYIHLVICVVEPGNKARVYSHNKNEKNKLMQFMEHNNIYYRQDAYQLISDP